MSRSKKQQEALAIDAMYKHSGKMSLIVRCFTALFISFYVLDGVPLPESLMWVVLFDVLQYFTSTAVWGLSVFRHNNPDRFKGFTNPAWSNIPGFLFFYLKGLTFIGFLLHGGLWPHNF